MDPAQRAVIIDTIKATARRARVLCRSFRFREALLMDVFELSDPNVEDERDRRRGD